MVRRTIALPLLLLAAACGPAPAGTGRPNTMLDAAAHDVFFPIAAGSKHALGSDSPAITCNSCHGGADSFRQYDCLSCHQHKDQTALTGVHRGLSQFSYQSASCYACHPRGAAGGAIPAGASSDPARSVTLTAQIPTYVDTSIARLVPQAETLPMPMLHASPGVPGAALASCANCHANAAAGVYYPGDLHLSLSSLNLPQPSSCSDCHASSTPAGFVGPQAAGRNPPSGEMKHDAVLWNNGAPGKASAVSQDCAVCHVTPARSLAATWATGRTAGAPVQFHASLTAAGLAQPASCLDCHANSRPALLTAANAALPANVQFDHGAGAALGDCTTCHTGAAQNTSWSGGLFHLPGSATPATCLPCHGNERPAALAAYPGPKFDYAPNTLGFGHGAGQDCVACHAGPGSGSWGGAPKQNWSGGRFIHGPGTLSATTCFECHTTQRPDLVYSAATARANLPANFDHSANGTGDCFGCHQASLTRSYATYWDGTVAGANSSDWGGGVGYPGAVLIGAPNQFITTTETTLNRSGANNLVTSMTAALATLNNEMLHTSSKVPWAISASDLTQCYRCHTGSNLVNGSPYANGLFHASLQSASLAQPASNCNDCHAQMRPAAIVAPAGSDLQPMDHSASFKSPVTLVVNGQATSVSSVSQLDCANCHTHPGTDPGSTVLPGPGWSDGAFHANVGAAVPADCTVCHYPLMADATKSDTANGVQDVMKHTSSQLTFQNCQVCHSAALSKTGGASTASTLWQTGTFHAVLASQPTACVACHAVSEPAANASTQSSVTYNFAQGGTASNGGQWMNHGSAFVTGKDCTVCHAADATTAGGPWHKDDSFHTAVAAPTSCKECHGLANGGGSAVGTNNNLPAGLTESSWVSSAASDSTTGVPAGTLDQITHADRNVSSHDCNFCHTQTGVSSVSGVQGKEWAQASFHANFTSGAPLVMDGNTGRCSDCHLNVKPGAGFTAFDHGPFTAAPGSQDCNSCHTWPGTGSPASPNWLGASAAPAVVTLTNWGYGSPTTNTVSFAHPAASTYTSCAQCHAGSSFNTIIDYNHDGLTRNVTLNGVAVAPNQGSSQYNPSTNPTFCVACHTSNSQWVSRASASSFAANTASGSTTVTTASTAALTRGMTVSGTGIPSTTTTTSTITGATVTAGSTTVTTAAPVTLRAGTVISGPGIPANDTVAASVTSLTSFTLTAAATASGTGVTLTATRTQLLTVTITAIPTATSFTISTAANATTTGTTLSVTHFEPSQFTIGNHINSTNGQDCTSCHFAGGPEHLTPPTAGVFASGSIGGN